MKPQSNLAGTDQNLDCQIGEDRGHIRCLGVVPVEIEDLLKEIQSEMEAE